MYGYIEKSTATTNDALTIHKQILIRNSTELDSFPRFASFHVQSIEQNSNGTRIEMFRMRNDIDEIESAKI